MNQTEKAAVQKLVTTSQASDVLTFSVTATDSKSAEAALASAKAAMAKNKNADYALVLVRKS